MGLDESNAARSSETTATDRLFMPRFHTGLWRIVLLEPGGNLPFACRVQRFLLLGANKHKEEQFHRGKENTGKTGSCENAAPIDRRPSVCGLPVVVQPQFTDSYSQVFAPCVKVRKICVPELGRHRNNEDLHKMKPCVSSLAGSPLRACCCWMVPSRNNAGKSGHALGGTLPRRADP